MLETRLVSSLAKIFPDEISGSTLESATALSNEPFSFQVAFKNADLKSDAVQIYVRIETDIGLRNISEYKVGFEEPRRKMPTVILSGGSRVFIPICCLKEMCVPKLKTTAFGMINTASRMKTISLIP